MRIFFKSRQRRRSDHCVKIPMAENKPPFYVYANCSEPISYICEVPQDMH